MRFWDSSAVVPLILTEQWSPACRAELRVDPAMSAWRFTRVEVESALRRQERDGNRTSAEIRFAERTIETLARKWQVVPSTDDIDLDAIGLLARYPLRAADALQLAAARAVTNGHPRGQVFVTRDDVLAKAARKEGFRVIFPRA